MARSAEPDRRGPIARLSITELHVYAGFAVLVFFGALGYGIWANWEPAGTALLFLCSALFAIVAGYLWFHERLGRTEAAARAAGDSGDDDVRLAEAEEPYLPHASVWPLEVGGGMTLTFCGLAMGRWVLIPGLVLLFHGLGGWILQSRRRG
jgi:hypothetical protein